MTGVEAAFLPFPADCQRGGDDGLVQQFGGADPFEGAVGGIKTGQAAIRIKAVKIIEPDTMLVKTAREGMQDDIVAAEVHFGFFRQFAVGGVQDGFVFETGQVADFAADAGVISGGKGFMGGAPEQEQPVRRLSVDQKNDGKLLGGCHRYIIEQDGLET